MAYVLDYTIIGNGLHYQASGTDHRSALANFLFNPNGLRAGYHEGNYVADDGEKLTVIGPTQESFSAFKSHVSRGRMLASEIATGGKGIREKQRRYAEWEALEAPQIETTVETFTLRERVVLDILSEDQIAHEDRIPELHQKIQEIGQGDKPVMLVLNKERQIPMGGLNIGVVETILDDGVRINNKLIPWGDIDNVLSAPVEIPSVA